MRLATLVLGGALGCMGAGEWISGEVVDPSGAPLADARVAVSTASRVSLALARSDGAGRFRVAVPAAGTYVVEIAHASFAGGRVQVAVTAGGDAAVRAVLGFAAARQEITVTAETGAASSTDAQAQRVNVAGAAAISARAVTALTEIAVGEPGVEQLRTSPTMGAFFVRGLTGKNVSVYRDGVRFTNGAQRGGVSTFQNLVEAANLESAEFLRGPNSAQYGSDSLGGTVNLLSHTPRLAPEGEPRQGGELRPQYTTGAQAPAAATLLRTESARSGWIASFSGGRVNTFRPGGGRDSHAAVTRYLGLPSALPGGRLPDSAFTHYGGSLHGQILLSPRSQLVAHYERAQQDGGKRTDQLSGGDGNLIAELRNLMLDFGYLRWHRFAAAWFDHASVSASYNTQREERVNQGGQGNPAGAITHQYERNKTAGVQFQFSRARGGHQWTGGGEGYWERMVAPAFTVTPLTGAVALSRPRVPDGARYVTHGLFLQDGWSPAAFSRLRAGGAVRFGGASYRAPGDSLSANALSGRAGATLRLAGPLALHAQWSRGFRAPNITDLGTLGLQGNGLFEVNVNDLAGWDARVGTRSDSRALSSGAAVARLRPETSGNVEAGVARQPCDRRGHRISTQPE